MSYAGFASPTGQKRLKSKVLDTAVLQAQDTEADVQLQITKECLQFPNDLDAFPGSLPPVHRQNLAAAVYACPARGAQRVLDFPHLVFDLALGAIADPDLIARTEPHRQGTAWLYPENDNVTHVAIDLWICVKLSFSGYNHAVPCDFSVQ